MLSKSLCCVAFLATITAGAQERHATSRGSILVGGSAEISHVSTNGALDTDATTALVAPNLLYLIRNRIAIGGLIDLRRLHATGSKGSSVTVGPAARLFLAEPGARIQPYVEGRVSWGKVSVESDIVGGGKVKRSSDMTDVGASAGMLLMASRQVGLSAEAYWDRDNHDEGNEKQTSYGIRFGFAAFLFK